jgi:phage-related protein (TIGR01555 family)
MAATNVVPLRTRIADGYANLMSRLGTRSDRSTAAAYFVPTLSQQQIEAAYRTSWLTRKVHDLIPFEMTRAGREWQADDKQIEALETLEIRLGLWLKLRKVLTDARLHGGAALVLGVRQGMPDQPLAVERLGKDALRYVVVVSRHQLTAPYGFDLDPESDFFNTPAMWQMRTARGSQIDIHPSRVIPFHGLPLPGGCLSTSQIDVFWGDPVFASIKSAIDNAEGAQASVATLLHEIKQDVISIPGLSEQIATEGAEARLAARIQAIAAFKSMFNALLLDGGDDEGKGAETWETRQLSFAQMPELLRQFVAIVAGAADIPVTRLMGESPGGLNSTGKGEQDDFNRMISARQMSDLMPALHRLDEILIRSALGTRPPEIYSTFAPLEEADEAQAAEIENKEADTVSKIQATNLIPSDALGKALLNRLVESGRWPGIDQAVDESDGELGGEPETDPGELPAAANENDVAGMERRGTITNDQAVSLLCDASPRSLYVSRKLLNASALRAWAKAQGFDTALPADDMHVTVVYSRAPVDWMKGADDWGGEENGGLRVPPGGPRLVEQFDGGAVVLAFGSSRLGWRHESLVAMGASSDRPDYQPHVTITYAAPDGLDLSKVEPYRGELLFGPEIFEEVKDGYAAEIDEEGL